MQCRLERERPRLGGAHIDQHALAALHRMDFRCLVARHRTLDQLLQDVSLGGEVESRASPRLAIVERAVVSGEHQGGLIGDQESDRCCALNLLERARHRGADLQSATPQLPEKCQQRLGVDLRGPGEIRMVGPDLSVVDDDAVVDADGAVLDDRLVVGGDRAAAVGHQARMADGGDRAGGVSDNLVSQQGAIGPGPDQVRGRARLLLDRDVAAVEDRNPGRFLTARFGQHEKPLQLVGKRSAALRDDAENSAHVVSSHHCAPRFPSRGTDNSPSKPGFLWRQPVASARQRSLDPY